jgi:hypothetical protein
LKVYPIKINKLEQYAMHKKGSAADPADGCHEMQDRYLYFHGFQKPENDQEMD